MDRDPSSASDLRRYRKVLRRHRVLIALTVIASLGAAAAATYALPPRHRAAMKIVIGQRGALFDPTVQSGSVADSFTQTMADLLDSEAVARATITELDLGISSRVLRDRLHVSLRPSTTVLDVTYVDRSPRRAVEILRTVGEQFTELVDERFGRPGPGVPVGAETDGRAVDRDVTPLSATVFDAAHVEDQEWPKPVRIGLIAGLLGLLGGIALAGMRESLRSKVTDEDDVEDAIEGATTVIVTTSEAADAFGVGIAALPERLRLPVVVAVGAPAGARAIAAAIAHALRSPDGTPGVVAASSILRGAPSPGAALASLRDGSGRVVIGTWPSDDGATELAVSAASIVIVVATMGQTSRDALRRAGEMLRRGSTLDPQVALVAEGSRLGVEVDDEALVAPVQEAPRGGPPADAVAAEPVPPEPVVDVPPTPEPVVAAPAETERPMPPVPRMAERSAREPMTFTASETGVWPSEPSEPREPEEHEREEPFRLGPAGHGPSAT